MSAVYLVVGLRAKSEKIDQVRSDLIEVVAPSRKESGCITYELFQDQNDPSLFIFYEHWASEKDQEHHYNFGPHIQNFQKEGMGNVEKIEFFHRLQALA
ncbi:antibiotic biosynthesis monooxygenase [Acinetobacter baumannii]|nr:antibiotic biosynthesis monooxygenase [Acinetobacter baumannii]